MDTKRIAILFSGNGSNLEALIKALHKKCFRACDLQNGGIYNGILSDNFLISGIFYDFREIDLQEGNFAQESNEKERNKKGAESQDLAKSSLQESFRKPFNVEIVLALSNKKDAYGLTRACNLGIPTQILESQGMSREAFDEELVRILKPLRLDLCVLAGFMRILTPLFTRQIKAINIHPSILPLYKGANGMAESYKSNMCLGGVSVHWVSDELDSGEMIAQAITAKNPKESLESYEAKIHALEHKVYPQAVLQALIAKS